MQALCDYMCVIRYSESHYKLKITLLICTALLATYVPIVLYVMALSKMCSEIKLASF